MDILTEIQCPQLVILRVLLFLIPQFSFYKKNNLNIFVIIIVDLSGRYACKIARSDPSILFFEILEIKNNVNQLQNKDLKDRIWV